MILFLFFFLCFLSFHGHGQKLLIHANVPKPLSFFFSFWSSLSSRFTYVHFELIFLEHLRNMDIVSFFCIYLISPAAFIRNCYYSMNILSVFATVGCRCVGFTPGFLLCFVNLNICQILCNPIYSWQRYKCSSKDNSMLFYKWCWSKRHSYFWDDLQFKFYLEKKKLKMDQRRKHKTIKFSENCLHDQGVIKKILHFTSKPKPY